MCREELMNREDRKAWKHMAKQADKIHTALKDRNESLAWTAEEWLRKRGTEWI